jgi:hypothetical protein
MDPFIAIVGLLSSAIAFILAATSASPLGGDLPRSLPRRSLVSLGRRIQLSMILSAIAAASNIWTGSALVSLVWIAFFAVQFANLQRVEDALRP